MLSRSMMQHYRFCSRVLQQKEFFCCVLTSRSKLSTVSSPQTKPDTEFRRTDSKTDTDNVQTEQHNLSSHPVIDLSFTNAEEAYKSKTTLELIRALLVFNLCSYEFIVRNNKPLLKWSRRLLGRTLFCKLMKGTFYGHFVAGEDQTLIRPLIRKNRMFGVKSILDYSVEEDLSSKEAKEAEMKSCVPTEEDEKGVVQDITAENIQFRAHEEFGDRREKVMSVRTYFYKDEENCDKNMKIFLDCIDAVSDATDKSGFAAVKLTALGRPQLLLQVSEMLVTMRRCFDSLTKQQGDSMLRHFKEDEFAMGLNKMGVVMSRDDSRKWFSVLDITQDGEVDLLDWNNLLEVKLKLSKLLVVPDPKTGELKPLAQSLSEEEEIQMKNMLRRINVIVKHACNKGVRVMIDAEQTYFQPAISRFTMEMMRKFNKEQAVVFNTYQCYLKQAKNNIITDMDLARREDFYFGAKLVRGAYMEQERERAESLGYEDPINPNFEATTEMYHSTLEEVLRQIPSRDKGKISLMVASHNEDTVRYTVEKLREYNIRPEDRLICFGQLLGMCDQVSFPLGQAGYSVYKYVPYGPVEDVLLYLSRRAMENRGMFGKVKKEKSLLWQEVWRRIRAGDVSHDPLGMAPFKSIVQ